MSDPTADPAAGPAAESLPDAAPPGPAGESAGQDELQALRAALEAAEATAAELRDQHLRAVAELDNQRKRAAREIDNARQFGIERFASELLAVVDSLEMGLEAGAEASADALLEGSQATLRLLQTGLQKFGIEVVDPAGEPFNPELHEAMTMQPSDTAEPGSVLAVIQRGYTLNGRLLRPARVEVAAAPAEA